MIDTVSQICQNNDQLFNMHILCFHSNLNTTASKYETLPLMAYPWQDLFLILFNYYNTYDIINLHWHSLMEGVQEASNIQRLVIDDVLLE